jgi:hypothetical protein
LRLRPDPLVVALDGRGAGLAPRPRRLVALRWSCCRRRCAGWVGRTVVDLACRVSGASAVQFMITMRRPCGLRGRPPHADLR